MNIEKLEASLQSLVGNISEQSFIYDLLLAYDQPKSSITRLQKGDYNLSKNQGEILWKKKLFFKAEKEADLHSLIDKLQSDPAITRHHPRFIIVTDFQTLLSVDTKIGDTLDIPITELAKYFDFFLPWAGMEKSQVQGEKLADIKAAERMGRLYDLILEDNPVENDADRHSLNIFLSRLLFCFFAEDTGIFDDGQFINAIASHTSDDGSDLQVYLQKLFRVLNLRERSDYPKFLRDFPYVNGGLFADDYPVPVFTAKSRKIIIECGALNWKQINPDIFGSMMQAVVHTEQRSNMGMHYTSVTNIMKVIEPLFLDDLREELEKAGDNEKKLEKLLQRLYHLSIFDPACGSGNFLIIAYKEISRIEIEVYRRLNAIRKSGGLLKSNISLSQFYGIELDDFAAETAKLSLWLAEHQMNQEFKEVFGDARPTLPLQDSGHIVCGNAATINWESVCKADSGFEHIILGNPPYLGSKNQNASQKADVKHFASVLNGYGILDYVACWFIKARNFMGLCEETARCAFVSTSSITQGEQVAVLWPYLLQENYAINFAVLPFNWTNHARNNAGVHCVIVGYGRGAKNKYIFNNGTKKSVSNISPYLFEGGDQVVIKRRRPLSRLPIMGIGNKPIDNGYYLFDDDEKNEFILSEPGSSNYFYRWYGGREYSGGGVRWCLLPQRIPDDELRHLPKVRELIAKVKEFRLKSSSKPTQKLAEKPRNFHVENFPQSHYMVIQKVSTGVREYLPVGFFDENQISSDLLNVVGTSDLSVFAAVSSKLHMVWMSAVGGRFRDGFRYSSSLCYNTFPFPEIDEKNRAKLEELSLSLLDEREKYSEMTIAELYDPKTMPESLKKAHHELDLAVEQCYRSRPFKSDEERLEYLFKLYEEMIAAEAKQGK